jgi:Tol biopolymer transport system component
MCDGSDSYDFGQIRDLLRAAFTAPELRRFCQDRERLRPVVDNFASNDGLNGMVDKVIDYCDARREFAYLLAEIRQERRAQYDRFGPYQAEAGQAQQPSRAIPLPEDQTALPPVPGKGPKPAGPRRPRALAIGAIILVLLALAAIAIAVRPFLLSVPTSNTPTPGPGGGRIAFSTFRHDPQGNQCEEDCIREIYTVNADGTGLTRVTTDGQENHQPAISPDGQRMVYWSKRGPKQELYLHNLNSGTPVRLTWEGGSPESPSWSPDGQRIAYERLVDGRDDIFVIGADGTGNHNLTRNPSRDTAPSWSPDGESIAFSSWRDGNADIYVLRVETALRSSEPVTPTRLTEHPARDLQPAWSPDGESIAFVSMRDSSDPKNGDIYVMGADGSNPTAVTALPDDERYPSWSPDGTLIAFRLARNGTGQIHVVEPDGTNLRSVSTHEPDTKPGTDDHPQWGK